MAGLDSQIKEKEKTWLKIQQGHKCLGRFWGIKGPYPSASKSNRWYADIFWFIFIEIGYKVEASIVD